MKYHDWLDSWLQNYVKIFLKKKTYVTYRGIVDVHINPELGDYDLSELTPLIIQKFISKLLIEGNKKTKEGMSTNSVNSIITVIKSSLSNAVYSGVIIENIAKNIKRPKILEKQVLCFSNLEQKKIESYILKYKEYKLYGVIICLYTGLRIGELMALKWEDIDLNKGILSITKTRVDIKLEGEKFQETYNSPKTKNSYRFIPIPYRLIPYLNELKSVSKTEYVIENKGKSMSIRGYQKAFSNLLIKLDIPHKEFHALRHTFATRAIECGVDVKTLSEILGHKNPMITLNRYVHSLFNHKLDMMNKVGGLLE